MQARFATRTDRFTATTERAGFLGAPGRQVFAALTLPGTSTAAVVVCPSILHDIEHTDRREVALAHALARAGMASVRFHPRGAGHSDDLADLSLDAMREDAEAALAALREAVPDRPIAVVGVRAGGLVAARLVAGLGAAAPLVLWEPAPDARSFLKDGFRAARMTRLVGGATAEELDADRSPLERLAAGEPVALHGYRVPPALLRDEATLDAGVRAGRGAVLVVQLGPRPKLAPALRRLVDGWAAGGRDAGAVVLEHPDGWLVTASEPAHEALVEVTVGWLRDRLGGHVADAAGADPMTAGAL